MHRTGALRERSQRCQPNVATGWAALVLRCAPIIWSATCRTRLGQRPCAAGAGVYRRSPGAPCLPAQRAHMPWLPCSGPTVTNLVAPKGVTHRKHDLTYSVCNCMARKGLLQKRFYTTFHFLKDIRPKGLQRYATVEAQGVTTDTRYHVIADLLRMRSLKNRVRKEKRARNGPGDRLPRDDRAPRQAKERPRRILKSPEPKSPGRASGKL